jgi:hypothetical protein
LWVLRYLFGVRDDETPFAWRGKAVEAGIDAIVLDDVADDVAIETAKRRFELLCATIRIAQALDVAGRGATRDALAELLANA